MLVMEERLTFKDGIFFGVPHRDRGLVGLPLVRPHGRAHLSELALVDHLVTLAPLSVQQFTAHQSLILHSFYFCKK